jgi:hypothetical protein
MGVVGSGMNRFVDSMATPSGKIILSIIWGIGLATLFRQACHGRQCIVVTSPRIEDVKGKVYKFGDGSCYAYHPMAAECSRPPSPSTESMPDNL